MANKRVYEKVCVFVFAGSIAACGGAPVDGVSNHVGSRVESTARVADYALDVCAPILAPIAATDDEPAGTDPSPSSSGAAAPSQPGGASSPPSPGGTSPGQANSGAADPGLWLPWACPDGAPGFQPGVSCYYDCGFRPS
jgi:hypothetical protein